LPGGLFTFCGAKASEKDRRRSTPAFSFWEGPASFASVWAGEGTGVADRESVESVNALPSWRNFPMSDALVVLCFVMIVLGPCVVAAFVDLDRSVPD
jgi:hypothetical protein